LENRIVYYIWAPTLSCMVNTETHTHMDVTYYDEWLDIENFVTLQADTEAEAREKFSEEVDNLERKEIVDVEHAFEMPDMIM
jgi:hypothetical protein